MKNPPKALVVLSVLLFMLPSIQAQITYVDAGADNTPNSGWNYRKGLANGGDVYEGQLAEALELATTIAGLSAGAQYKLYGFFWGSNDQGSWCTDFGLHSGSLTTYTETSPLASSLSYVTKPLFNEGNRTLHAADLGVATANASGEIVVYIDNNDGVFNLGTRAWYDGVGYERLGGGESTPAIASDPIPAAVNTDDPDYKNWGAAQKWAFGNEGTRGNEDFDRDGLDNNTERIFGLDPTDASSANPFVSGFDHASQTLVYTRRDRALTGLEYSVWYSTDNIHWKLDVNAVQSPGPSENSIEQVTVKISKELLTETKLYLQIRVGE